LIGVKKSIQKIGVKRSIRKIVVYQISYTQLGSLFSISAEDGNTDGICLPAVRQFKEHLKSQ